MIENSPLTPDPLKRAETEAILYIEKNYPSVLKRVDLAVDWWVWAEKNQQSEVIETLISEVKEKANNPIIAMNRYPK
jgi:hypothetical protein